MYVKVTVTPKAKKESFTETGERQFSVSVKEPAERNLANRRVIELIAQHFEISVKRVRIISGHRSPKKVLDIESDAV